MNYVTTNIRIPEDDYLRLKNEAARKRISFSQVVRTRLQERTPVRTKEETDKLITESNILAKKLGKKLKGLNTVKIIRKMREDRTKHLWKLSMPQ
jgi:hypothetical protein